MILFCEGSDRARASVRPFRAACRWPGWCARDQVQISKASFQARGVQLTTKMSSDPLPLLDSRTFCVTLSTTGSPGIGRRMIYRVAAYIGGNVPRPRGRSRPTCAIRLPGLERQLLVLTAHPQSARGNAPKMDIGSQRRRSCKFLRFRRILLDSQRYFTGQIRQSVPSASPLRCAGAFRLDPRW